MQDKSPRVIRSNVRFSGTLDQLHVNVWFRDRIELQSLIDALIKLRDSTNDQIDHAHLQHYDLTTNCQLGLAEINFFRPGRGMTDLEKGLADSAIHELRNKT